MEIRGGERKVPLGPTPPVRPQKRPLRVPLLYLWRPTPGPLEAEGAPVDTGNAASSINLITD